MMAHHPLDHRHNSPLARLGPTDDVPSSVPLYQSKGADQSKKRLLRLKPKAVELLICTTPLLIYSRVLAAQVNIDVAEMHVLLNQEKVCTTVKIISFISAVTQVHKAPCCCQALHTWRQA